MAFIQFRRSESAASKYPDKTAIIDGDSSYTFSGLENFSSKFSGALKTLGSCRVIELEYLPPTVLNL
ncbi:MAG: hypothetical protein CM1200mP30_04540 [Pseudomonadota bacterium]|nr:MAG: hypothetical protein CM1200mP30_04540 [Pseudomonadota bacterium]